MMYPKKPFNIEFAIKAVEDIVTQRLASVATDVRIELYTCLADDLTAVIPQLNTSEEQIFNTLWLRIRENYSQAVLNFILTGTSEMMMRFKSRGWDNEEVSTFFTETIAFNKGKSSIVEKVLIEQMVSAEDARKIFTNNAWYIFVVILTMTNLRSTIITILEKAKEPAGKAK